LKLDSEEKTKWVSIVKRGKIEGEYKSSRSGRVHPWQKTKKQHHCSKMMTNMPISETRLAAV
jgi:hypothetical protein